MNEKKFEFMIHLTDGNLTPELTRSLEELVAPEGYVVEVQPVTGDEKYLAYETAMRASDAKYKIYLDERAVIVKEDFLIDLLAIFQSDAQIGAVGTGGAIELPLNGISFYSDKHTDKNYSGEVAVIDGYLFATQYDLPWRHEEFRDGFFGGQAQCAEFKRAGYKLWGAAQVEPWLSHDEITFASDKASCRLFLDEYAKDFLPLVTVIIPTFNRPEYLREALESALNQTYRNIEVVISDNSTDDATERLVADYDDKRIKYFRHKGFDAHENWNFARSYNNPAAEYVNWLMDDDIFYSTKLEQMLEIYRANPDVSLVTSRRNIIDEYGQVLGEVNVPVKISEKIGGSEAGRLLFTEFKNYIGEPTTVLIRKKFLRDNDLCWDAADSGFFNLADISTWCQLLTQGDLYFIDEVLSAYRAHKGIASGWEYTPPLAAIQWARLIKQAWEQKAFLTTETELRTAILGWFELQAVRGLRLPLQNDYHGAEVETLEKYFVAMAQALSNGYKLELPAAEYSAQDAIKKIR